MSVNTLLCDTLALAEGFLEGSLKEMLLRRVLIEGAL